MRDMDCLLCCPFPSLNIEECILWFVKERCQPATPRLGPIISMELISKSTKFVAKFHCQANSSSTLHVC